MGTMSLIISYWSSAKNKRSHTAPQSGSWAAGYRRGAGGTPSVEWRTNFLKIWRIWHQEHNVGIGAAAFPDAILIISSTGISSDVYLMRFESLGQQMVTHHTKKHKSQPQVAAEQMMSKVIIGSNITKNINGFKVKQSLLQVWKVFPAVDELVWWVQTESFRAGWCFLEAGRSWGRPGAISACQDKRVSSHQPHNLR